MDHQIRLQISKVARGSVPPTKKTKALDSESTGEITNIPDSSLMMKTCEVLYDDNKWYKGTIMGLEQIDGIWNYKITFSDGDSTYAAKDDPEVHFP